MPQTSVWIFTFSTVLSLCSCGFVSVQPSDAAVASDAAPGLDVGFVTDGGPAMDAGAAMDAGRAVDGGPDTDPIADAGPDMGTDAGPSVRISIARVGDGSGNVRSPSGLDCGATCVVDVPLGTEIVLNASAAGNSWFEGWSGGPCSGRASCGFSATVDVAVEARFTPVPNRVFISSIPHNGDFGGLTGADAQCGMLAAGAGLPGNWIAMLTTSTSSSFARLAGSRGFIRVDDQPVADQNLSAPLWFPIRVDENGDDVGDVLTWTMNGGSASQCAAWTSASAADTGRGGEADRAWAYSSGGGELSCSQLRHFYCAEIGQVVPIAPSLTAGRGSFVTTATWLPDGGIASADSLCASEATGAGLPGTYRAFLATEGASAIARLPDGLPWVRSDGTPLLPRASDWRTDRSLDVAPVFDAAGRPHDYRLLLMGAPSLAAAGTSTSTCGNWTLTTGSTPACLRTWFTDVSCGSSFTCSAQRLLCLQE